MEMQVLLMRFRSSTSAALWAFFWTQEWLCFLLTYPRDDSHAQRISLPQYERSEGVLSAYSVGMT